MSDFDLNQIRRLDGGLLLVFRELLRTGRASLVAERLGLSQSAISHALSRLRDLFQDQLFVRRPHGFEPTRRALELGPSIEALVDMAGAALSREGGFDPARSQRLFRVGAPEFVTALVGAKLIESFRRSAPKLSFWVGFQAEAAALDGLRRGEIDLALGRFGQAPPGFISEVLFQDRYCVVAREGHPRVKGSIDYPTYLEVGHVFAQSRSEISSDDHRSSIGELHVAAAVPGWLTALVLTASSDGVATCPRRLAERHAPMMGLQVLDPPFGGEPITVSAVRRAGVDDAGAEWFLEQVRQAVVV
jgi:LysR family transcriptional activator of mexEF-oprN operon